MIDLYGFKFSVYAWIARFALHEKDVDYNWIEVNPFAEDVDPAYLEKHPFGRVPTLVQGGFTLYETGAITRYVDDAFSGSPLKPTDLMERARLDQVISIVDNYTYWPLVRQVFSHDVMGPRVGRPSDPNEVTRGLEASKRTLDVLENLIGDGGFIVGRRLSLADIHLAPMLSYFSEAKQGADGLQQRPKLASWFASIAERDAFKATKPNLPPPIGE